MLEPEREAEVRENVRLEVRTSWTRVADLLAEIDRLRIAKQQRELDVALLRGELAETQRALAAAQAYAKIHEDLEAQLEALREAGDGLARLAPMQFTYDVNRETLAPVPGTAGEMPQGTRWQEALAAWRKAKGGEAE